MIELTEEQARAVASQKSPLHLMNPLTREVFVLIRKEVYDLTCNIVGGGRGRVGHLRRWHRRGKRQRWRVPDGWRKWGGQYFDAGWRRWWRWWDDRHGLDRWRCGRFRWAWRWWWWRRWLWDESRTRWRWWRWRPRIRCCD